MKKNSSDSMTITERKIITITCLGHFLSHFNMLFFPALVLPLANYYGTDLSDIVGRSFWMYCFFGITALPWGIAADRWGARRLMMIFHIGAGMCCFSAALWMDNLLIMSICLAGLGAFSGIYHPTGLGWISRSVSRISFGMAINGIFGNLGLAVSPLVAGILNWMYGIKAVFWFAGAINLMGVFVLVGLPVPSEIQGKVSRNYSGKNMIKPFIMLLLAMMLGGVVYRGATVILPAYFELKNQGIFDFFIRLSDQLSPNVIATMTVTSVFIAGMIGQYTGGRVAEHFDLRKCYLIFHVITIPMVITMACVSNVMLVVATMLYFFFLLGMQPIENTLVAKLSPPQFIHSAYGTKFILTFGVGAFSVKMVAAIERHTGMSSIFLTLAGISCLLVLSILGLIAVTQGIFQTLGKQKQTEHNTSD
ncbi:MAG: MFS transporter [Candidatus Magnetomorum sp.]|nr:MFS transporter [Candidatus Magnetomorum sp.]